MNQKSECDILLVEDNPEDAEATIRTLKKQNVANHLVWVKDGAEALDFLFCTGAYKDRDGSHVPKVVMLDLKLPRMDGLEMLKKMRADKRTQLIPVVVLTSSVQDEDRIRSYELGANSYVSKPVKFEEFARIVAQLGMYWMMVNKPPAP